MIFISIILYDRLYFGRNKSKSKTHIFFQQPILQRILQQARDSVDKLFVAVSDQFELCLAKCRTSSKVCLFLSFIDLRKIKYL